MFSKKALKVVIEGYGTSFIGGNNSITFENMPIEAKINWTRLPAGASAKIMLYGVSKQHMDMITTIQWNQSFINEKAIYLYANDGNGYQLLFEGQIMSAIPNYEASPDVYIEISANAGAFHNLKELPPFSLKGEVPVPVAVSSMCLQYGVSALNVGGVSGIAKNPYFDQHGMSARLQAMEKAYGFYTKVFNNRVELFTENGNVFKTWDLTSSDYVGYPKITNVGIQVMLDGVKI